MKDKKLGQYQIEHATEQNHARDMEIKKGRIIERAISYIEQFGTNKELGSHIIEELQWIDKSKSPEKQDRISNCDAIFDRAAEINEP